MKAKLRNFEIKIFINVILFFIFWYSLLIFNRLFYLSFFFLFPIYIHFKQESFFFFFLYTSSFSSNKYIFFNFNLCFMNQLLYNILYGSFFFLIPKWEKIFFFFSFFLLVIVIKKFLPTHFERIIFWKVCSRMESKFCCYNINIATWKNKIKSIKQRFRVLTWDPIIIFCKVWEASIYVFTWF